MNAAQVEDSSDVIMGNLPVNDIPARVLFDTGASHCFMSKPFFTKHEFVSSQLVKQMDIVSPGKRLSASLEVPDVTITLGDYKFLSSPMVLGNLDIDLILGMDWLFKHRLSLIVQPGRFN